MSLLEKYELQVENLSYSFIDQCTDTKTLERIVRVLRSGEEGTYPHLLSHAEEKLRALFPTCRLLRSLQPVVTNASLDDNLQRQLLEDLKQFTTNMKMQEVNMVSAVATKVGLPAVRTSETKTVGEQNVEPSKVLRSAKPRDYSEWDKLDVDRELKRMEIEEERERELAVVWNRKRNERNSVKEEVASSLQQNILIADMSPQERSYWETQERQKGNECFKAGEYMEALCHYTKCLHLEESVDAYNNRAMAYLKLKQYSEAIQDCNRVLEMDSDNVKAYYRRSVANQNLSNLVQARDDMARVAQLQPDMRAAKVTLDKLEKQCAAVKSYRMPITDIAPEESAWRQDIAEVRKKDCYKNEKTSSRPKIIELCDVRNAYPRKTGSCKITPVKKGCSPGRRNAGSKTRLCEDKSDSAVVKDNGGFVGSKNEEPTKDVCTKDTRRHGKVCDVCLMEGRSPGYKCSWIRTPPKTPAKSRQKKFEKIAELPGGQGTVGRSKGNNTAGMDEVGSTEDDEMDFEPHLSSSETIPEDEDGSGLCALKPSSPYNFVKLWQVLRDGDANLLRHAQLLKKFNPSQLPRVLGNKLDGEMLGIFLHCLNQHFDLEKDGRLVAEYMDQLSYVQRFRTVSMMLGPEERRVANRLLGRLKESGFTPRRFESAFLG